MAYKLPYLITHFFQAVSFAERISNTPDVSWNRSPSSSSNVNSGVVAENNVRPSSLGRGGSVNGDSDSDRFPITGGSGSNSRSGSRSSSPTGSASGFGFDGDNSGNSNGQFPITGGSSGGRFDSNNGNSRGSSGSRFGSSSGVGSWGSGSGSSFSATTPDPTKNYYVRVIASLIDLTNAKSLTSTGGSCATFGKCDPIVYADLDT